MHGQSREPALRPRNVDPTIGSLRPRSAITWVDRRRAIVVKTAPDGAVEVDRIERDAPGDGRTYLARIAHALGDEDRVVVVGPWLERTELEREYVAVWGHPERLVDVEPSGPLAREAADLDDAALVEALRRVPVD